MVHLLTLALLLGNGPAWELAGETGAGLRWYTRARPGSPVRELLATGVVSAPPGDVWAVLMDFDGYPRTMPSTVKAKAVATDGAGVFWVYSRYELPLIAPRDTIVRMVAEVDEAAGHWQLSWSAVSDKDALMPQEAGVVRVRTNEGRWRLESSDGRTTRVTYQLYSLPGGDVPPFLIDHFGGLGVPATFESLQRAAANLHARRAALK